MRKTLLLAAALTVAATTAGHASPAPDEPRGCGFASQNDVSGVVNQDLRHNYGEIHGGPSILALLDGNTGTSGTLTCWLQTTSTYGGTALAGTLTSGSGDNGVIVITPREFEFDVDTTSDVYLCQTIKIVGGSTYYYDDISTHWLAGGATTATCALAIQAG
ncbi:MAG TPA: hypothetical protein VFQ85_07295 [Mycobacteriales bacterium]|jgi:hypothetical protein|nr:hypothetical protein [Mycobacteriales bacterium]